MKAAQGVDLHKTSRRCGIALFKCSSKFFATNCSQEVAKADREVIARLKNCILALASFKMLLYDTSIIYAYEESMKYTVSL